MEQKLSDRRAFDGQEKLCFPDLLKLTYACHCVCVHVCSGFWVTIQNVYPIAVSTTREGTV